MADEAPELLREVRMLVVGRCVKKSGPVEPVGAGLEDEGEDAEEEAEGVKPCERQDARVEVEESDDDDETHRLEDLVEPLHELEGGERRVEEEEEGG